MRLQGSRYWDDIMGKCKDCKWWAANESYPTDNFAKDNLLQAECRRHSPIFLEKHRSPVWPKTKEDDWCGDFEYSKKAFKELVASGNLPKL